jgi:hypothetical protein
MANKFSTALLLAASLYAYAAEPDADGQKLIKRIPAGYRLYNYSQIIDEKGEDLIARGDLNGDGADDYALVIENIANNNISGIMIFFKDGNDYKLALENRNCFNSGKDLDFGLSTPHSINIAKGNLYLNYSQMFNCDYSNQKYTARYRNSEFELIGYDDVYTSCGRYGEAGDTKTSINFPAKKQLNAECPYKKKCKETWTTIAVKEPILLRKLSGIDFGTIISKYIVNAD